MKSFVHITILTILTHPLCAQDFYNNGAVISIKANTMVSVGEDLVNKGRVQNEGTFLIRGDWTNNNTYQSTEGTVILGGEDQTIDQGEQPFANLAITGGGSKNTQTDLHIAGDLSLEEGIVNSTNQSRLFLLKGSTGTLFLIC